MVDGADRLIGVVSDATTPAPLFSKEPSGVRGLPGGLWPCGRMLGLFGSPSFSGVPVSVSAGLMMVAITGSCGMEHILMRALGNKAAYRPAQAKAI